MKDVAPRPFFLPSQPTSLFAVYYPALTARGSWLFVPPFGEEMNKSRRMVARQSRLFAKAGWNVLVVDLFACGDSDGDFEDARWALWRQNLVDAWHWLAAQSTGPTGLWGLRLGGTMAVMVAEQEKLQPDKVLLWQPVIKGSNYLTQFLRLRTAASMLGSEGDKETPKLLRAKLDVGESLEIAGYSLNPSLAESIDTWDLGAMAPPADAVCWYELAVSADKPFSLPSQSVIQTWQQQGCRVQCRMLAGDSFWTTTEISESPALLQASVEDLS